MKVEKTIDISIDTISIEDVCKEWLYSKKLQVKESTYCRYYSLVNNHILPFAMKENTNDCQIQEYLYSLLKQGYSEKTVRDIWGTIKNLVNYSLSKGINLGIDIPQIRIKKKKVEVSCLDIDEQKKLCSFLLEDLNYKNFGILLALYTGIRIGELCALKWKDVNFDNSTLSITKTLIRIPEIKKESTKNKTKIIITQPKSDSSIRDIPIPFFLISLGENLTIDQNNYLLSGTENYIEPRNMQYYFQKTLEQNGIRRVNFHALRHTFATRCVENNFDIKTLSEILGHSSINTTLELYVHPSMELKRKNMNKLSLMKI